MHKMIDFLQGDCSRADVVNYIKVLFMMSLYNSVCLNVKQKKLIYNFWSYLIMPNVISLGVESDE